MVYTCIFIIEILHKTQFRNIASQNYIICLFLGAVKQCYVECSLVVAHVYTRSDATRRQCQLSCPTLSPPLSYMHVTHTKLNILATF